MNPISALKTGLTVVQLATLHAAQGQPKCLTTIARTLNISNVRLTAAAYALEKRKLVSRTQGDDRRRSMIAITEAGLRMLAKACARSREEWTDQIWTAEHGAGLYGIGSLKTDTAVELFMEDLTDEERAKLPDAETVWRQANLYCQRLAGRVEPVDHSHESEIASELRELYF